MDSLGSISLFLVVMTTAFLCAKGLLYIPFVARVIDEEEKGRFAAIDGIRGFLALSVFVHHFAVHRQYLQSEIWLAPRDRFLAMAGSIPVQIFFIITGFLFWNRAIRGDGKIDVRSFAISRFFRIAPMYALVMAVAFGLALASTGFKYQGDAGETYHVVTRFLTFGAFRIEYFGGVDLMPITAGVAWTLVYEWGFYAALPLIAWFAKWPRFPLLAALFLLLLAIKTRPELQYSTLFLVGMASADVVHAFPAPTIGKQNWASGAMAVLLFASYFAVDFEPASIGFIFLLPVFLGLANGVDLYGVLTSRPARLLGAASYSIYLIHGPILYVALQGIVGKERVLAMLKPAEWALELVLVLTVCLLSTIAYIAIERPMMRLGKRIAKTRVGVE